jgi:maltooligosyltrehalose trehalohydrolase
MKTEMRDIFGASPLSTGECLSLVWAPYAENVNLRILNSSQQSIHELGANGKKLRPDPAPRCQPQGVHGPSEAVADHLDWHDVAWRGLDKRKLVFYEIHSGTFTPQVTFHAIISRLRNLRDLGITAIEIVPVGQFPGERNWGYDGVFPLECLPESAQQCLDLEPYLFALYRSEDRGKP